MRQLSLILFAALLLGCHAGGSTPRLRQPEKQDDFDRFGTLMRDETGFYDELKRLQALYTAPPDPAYAAPADYDTQYALSSRVEANRAGLVLKDRQTGEEWVLWAWQDTNKPVEQSAPNAATPGASASAEPTPSEERQSSIVVMRDEESMGGYRLELAVGNGAAAVTLNARWVQGRYFQVTRELILGGLDSQQQAGPGAVGWVLDGPWLPYRMLPACSGPYGVLPDSEADAQWHSANYPFGAMLPAVAAYDRRHGALIAVVDEHPRKADRSYTLSYRIPPDMGRGAQLALSYKSYDTTSDNYAMPYMSSGLPLRDSIVIAPLKLTYTSVDPTLVEAETLDVIQQLGQLTRAYHFLPKPPKALAPGGFVWLSDWVGADNDTAELLRQAGGVWGCRFAELQTADAKLDASGMAGIGAADLSGGAGLDKQLAQMLAGIPQDVLSVVAAEEPLVWRGRNAYARACPTWLALDQQGKDIAPGAADHGAALLDIRSPQVAAWAVRKMAGDLQAYPCIAGYSLRGTCPGLIDGQSQSQGPYFVPYAAAASALSLRSAEAVGAARSGALIACDKGLRLCLPAFASCYKNGTGVFGVSFGSESTSPPVPFENRLSNDVFWEVFGVKPYLGFGGADLASQVLATTFCISGHGILRVQQRNAGGIVAAPYPDPTAGQFEWFVVNQSSKGDDFIVADEVVACLAKAHLIDPTHVHSMGMSAGALQTTALSFFRSEWLASVATYSGGMPAGFAVPAMQDPDNKFAALIFDGGTSDSVYGVDFKAASEAYASALTAAGHYAELCDHGGGHAIPLDAAPSVELFFTANPFGAWPSPYASAGIPQSFPAYCAR